MGHMRPRVRPAPSIPTSPNFPGPGPDRTEWTSPGVRTRRARRREERARWQGESSSQGARPDVVEHEEEPHEDSREDRQRDADAPHAPPLDRDRLVRRRQFSEPSQDVTPLLLELLE